MPGILEAELPGIGRRFTLPLESGGELAVVVHKSGDKDLYFREPGGDDPIAVELGDGEAKRLAAVLTGGFWQPSPIDMFRAALAKKAGLETVTVLGASPIVGRKITDLEIRRRTGCSIVAILREDGSSLPNPAPETAVEANDILVVIADAEGVAKLEDLVHAGA
jgi:TrkA domain protein